MRERRHLARFALGGLKRPEDGIELGLRAALDFGVIQYGEHEIEDVGDRLAFCECKSSFWRKLLAHRIRCRVVHRSCRVADRALVTTFLEGGAHEGLGGE